MVDRGPGAAERAADEFRRAIDRLQADAMFLARTPPPQRIRRMPTDTWHAAMAGPAGDDLRETLQQVFLAIAHARPAYLQLRLIDLAGDGPELVRVERVSGRPVNVTRGQLQNKGQRYYVSEASQFADGDIYLSRIDLNREHGQISLPEQPVLRALTPVSDATAAPRR